ncbi:MAG: GNAT family N-acetyltransferase [Theionarchaea archaeon]|nr:GNAT family N-acetyltransferase [Theionarchaea archaeon]MBU7037884.1 GNAT family N-acetyltransferase [Theionarchaea archaeon]
MDIMMNTWDDVDIHELAHFAFRIRHAEGQLSTTTLEQIEQQVRHTSKTYASRVVTAHSEDMLLGWLYLIIEYPRLVLMGDWHPIVFPGDKEGETAARLIEESIEYTRREKRERLEVALSGITEKNSHLFTKQKEWYESQGMGKVSEEISMECVLTGSLDDVEFPEDVNLKLLTEIDNDKIYPYFNETFLASRNMLWLDQTAEQQRVTFDYWFSRSRPLNEKASIILMSDQQVIGFSVSRPTAEGVYLEPFGIHPEYRKRGLGRALLLHSMKIVAQQGLKTMSLGVDIENRPACQLYRSAGFKELHRNVVYCWKDVHILRQGNHE